MTSVRLLRRLTAIVLFAVTAAAAAADPRLAGTYDAAGKTAEGTAYSGQVRIDPKGKGFRLAWVLDSGERYRGLGLRLDGILGSAYWPDDEAFEGAGIVVYRIDGGLLEGIWMPHGGPSDLLGEEALLGPASLDGRFDIVLGFNPGGRSQYTGHVEIERRGETYHFHWYTPVDSYLGNGIRIGNIMVVGYALGRAPGTVAYCVRGAELDGLWAYGTSSRLGREVLHPQSGTGARPNPAAGPECLPTIAMNAVPQ